MPDSIRYEIDADDILVSTGGLWKSFAGANGAEALDPVGLTLWDAVADGDAAAAWKLLVERVRATGRPIVFPFRCDAPTKQRLFEMKLTPLESGGVQFSSRLIEERDRDAVSLVDSTRERSEDIVVVCGWCSRVRIDGWVEPEDAVRELGLVGDADPPRVSHGICDVCAAEVQRLAELGSP